MTESESERETDGEMRRATGGESKTESESESESENASDGKDPVPGGTVGVPRLPRDPVAGATVGVPRLPRDPWQALQSQSLAFPEVEVYTCPAASIRTA